MPSSPVLSNESLATESREVFVWLLELDHASLSEPIRLSSDKGELYGYDEESGTPIYCTRHGGQAYIEAAFSYVPPGNPQDGQIPEARLVVASERRIIQALRDLHAGLTLRAFAVYASDPETIISEFPDFWLSAVNYDAAQIEATLSLKHFLNEPCGWLKCYPSITPALFKNGLTVA